MTVGIYKLTFAGTDKCYIGQSVHIEKRYKEHLNAMTKGFAKIKLQEAYSLYGTPTLEVILDEVPIKELNSVEVEAISLYDSVKNGFNTLEYTGNPDIRGVDSCNAKLTEAEYVEIFRLLATTNISIKDIADAMDTTENIVGHINLGKTHQWLREKYPEYTKLLEKKLSRGGRYFTKLEEDSDRMLVSPEGQVYCVSNMREFCREHGLNSGHISSVLAGNRKTHKGWKKHQEAAELASL